MTIMMTVMSAKDEKASAHTELGKKEGQRKAAAAVKRTGKRKQRHQQKLTG